METQTASVNDELLKLLAAAVVTATTNGTAIDLGNGYAPAMGGQPMLVPVPVTAIKTSATNETYVLTVQDSPDNAAWTTRGTVTITAVGLSQAGVFIQQRYVRAVLTLGGTSPSITIGNCYLNPQTLG